jgi:hypothetical protein
LAALPIALTMPAASAIAEVAKVLQGVGDRELVRVAIAFQRPAHESLIEAAFHSSAANDAVKTFWRNADLLRKRERLGIKRGVAEREEIVEQLHAVPVAGRPDMHDFSRPGLQHRL